MPVGDEPGAKPSTGAILRLENAQGNISGAATIAWYRNSSCPRGAFLHADPPATALTGKGSLSFTALENIRAMASNAMPSGTLKPSWSSAAIALDQLRFGDASLNASTAFS